MGATFSSTFALAKPMQRAYRCWQPSWLNCARTWCLPSARSLPSPCGNTLSPSRSFLWKLWIRSLQALSPTWHDRMAISPASPISSSRWGRSGCSCLRTAHPVLTGLRWFLIQPIRHGLHICARLRLPHHRSVYGYYPPACAILPKLHNALLHLPATRMALLSSFQAALRLVIAKPLSSQRHVIACPRSIRTVSSLQLGA